MMSKHTELPWYHDKKWCCVRKAMASGKQGGRNGGPVLFEESEHGNAFPIAQSEADMAFAVLAANSHYPMLEALRMAHATLTHAEIADRTKNVAKQVWEAIQLADGVN